MTETIKPHYKPDDTKFAGLIEDIGTTTGSVCSHWKCIRWIGDTKMLPELVEYHNGYFMVRKCPICGRCY